MSILERFDSALWTPYIQHLIMFCALYVYMTSRAFMRLSSQGMTFSIRDKLSNVVLATFTFLVLGLILFAAMLSFGHYLQITYDVPFDSARAMHICLLMVVFILLSPITVFTRLLNRFNDQHETLRSVNAFLTEYMVTLFVCIPVGFILINYW